MKVEEPHGQPALGLKVIRLDLAPVVISPCAKLWTKAADFLAEALKGERVSSSDGFVTVMNWAVVRGRLPAWMPVSVRRKHMYDQVLVSPSLNDMHLKDA